MRIAILIGVSEYTGKVNKLPACKRDVDAMSAVIKATEKYDEILTFSGLVPAAEVKAKISEAIKSLSGSQIEEAFFYYTGHGDFRDDEFFYILSDFTEDKLRQTALQNSEIDNWLRTLKPTLAIKVVDACHAGLTYVKDKKHIETLLQKSLDQFKHCYFMFSSTAQQYSYQDDNLSFFTQSFLEAIDTSDSENIRYKDIIDFISDEFSSNDVQTPVFVTQATFTEIFSQRTTQLADVTKELVASANPVQHSEKELPIMLSAATLEEKIKNDAERYPPKEEVTALLAELKSEIGLHVYEDQFVSLNSIESSFEQTLYYLPKKADIGGWLDKHPDTYFATVEETEEAYQARVRRYPYSFGQSEYETRYRRKVVGFELTDPEPYHWIKLVAKPKYPNIPWCNCSLVLLLSKKFIRFFYFFTEYSDKNWDERELKENFNWKTAEFPLVHKVEIRRSVLDIQNQFADWVIEQVKGRLPDDGQPATPTT